MSKTKQTILLFIALINLFSFPILAQKKKAKTKVEPVKITKPAFEKYIDENQDAHLKEFLELISIPSISSIPANKPDVEKAANWIVNKLKAIGIPTTKVIETGGQPAVFGSWDKAPGKPTVLIYAHYDVQPVKESEWVIPPFAPVVKNGRIYGRGASDDKSGVMISIWAVEAMLKTKGTLPVNVKFVFEGEVYW
jgi:acetylornithine deacetylase/succinyl-diaminopimelate desuccinylase-like protein